MLEESNGMDEQLRAKFEAFEMTPPDAAWVEIKKSLIVRKSRYNGFFLIVGLLFMAVFSWYLVSGGDQLHEKWNKKVLVSKNNSDYKLTTNSLESNIGNRSQAKSEFGILSMTAEKYKNLSESAEKFITKEYGARAETAVSSKQQANRKVNTPNNLLSSSATSSTSTKGTEIKSESVEVVQKRLEKIMELKPVPLISNYYVNSANPTRYPFRYNQPVKMRTFGGRGFSIEGSLGLSTFRMRAVDGASLSEVIQHANSAEVGFGGEIGMNYHLDQRFSISAGIEWVAQQSNVAGKLTENYTTTTVDTVGFDTDSTFNIQDSMWYVDTTWLLVNTNNQYAITTNVNVMHKNTMLLLPFSFAYKKQIGIRSSLEFHLGGSVGIYQQVQGNIIKNEFGQLVAAETAKRSHGQLMVNASIKYLYQFGVRHGIYMEPQIGFGINNYYQQNFDYQSRISQLGIKMGYRVYF